MTEKENILSDITTKLADFSGIVPLKVREVLIRILNYISTANQIGPLNTGSINIGDINDNKAVGYEYLISGNITSAVLSQKTSSGSVIIVTVANVHSSLDYYVDIKSPESLGVIEFDNDIHTIVWQKINENSFYIYLEDMGRTQNIKIHIETKLS